MSKVGTDTGISPLEDAITMTGWGFYNKFLILFSAACYFANGFAFVNLPLYLPLIACDILMGKSTVDNTDLGLSIGVAFGGFILSAISDVVGRKSIITASLIIIFISMLTSCFVYGEINLIFSQLLFGFGISGNMITMKIHLAENMPILKRNRSIIFLDIFWNIGVITGTLISFGFIPLAQHHRRQSIRLFSWRFLYGTPGLISIFAACASSLILISPRYLLFQKRTSEALNVLREMFSINNSKIATTFTLSESNLQNKVKDYDINQGFDLVRNISTKCCSVLINRICRSIRVLAKKFTKTIIIITIIKTLTSFEALRMMIILTRSLMKDESCYYKGVPAMHFKQHNLTYCYFDKEENNPQWDFLAFAILSIIGEIIFMLAIPFLDKKYLFIIALFLSAVTSIILAFIFNTYIIRFILSSVFILTFSIAKSAISIIAIDSFPTCIRATAYGQATMIATMINYFFRRFFVGTCKWFFGILSTMFIVGALTSFGLGKFKNRPMTE